MSKLCTGCNQPIHPKRLEIMPNATRCVACSTTNKKAGITITRGEGDHTYNETIIMEHEDYVRYREMEEKINGKRKDDIGHPELDEDEDETESNPTVE
jgi:hypothetical protein